MTAKHPRTPNELDLHLMSLGWTRHDTNRTADEIAAAKEAEKDIFARGRRRTRGVLRSLLARGSRLRPFRAAPQD